MVRYSLYHTLNQNIPTEKFLSKQKKDLFERHSLLDNEGKEAFLMLICEHARLHSGYVYNSENQKLPYGGLQKNRNTVFTVEKLPPALKWILVKFLDIVCK